MNQKNAGKVPQGIAREYQPNQPPGKLTHPPTDPSRLKPAASHPSNSDPKKIATGELLPIDKSTAISTRRR